jgi:signal-transduction protein with cAMP-binding, CBS, and nucleotidyltransferase domain
MMSIFSNVLSFGAGYAAGVRVGDRPLVAARSVLHEGQRKMSAVASQASYVRGQLTGARRAAVDSSERTAGSGTTIDVREVREVMTAAPETIRTDAPVREAAEILERADIGSVIAVEDDEHVRGIVTDRDIALRVVASGRDAAETTVEDVMTPSPATIAPTATVREAVALMKQYDVRRLPVVEAGRPIGVIALADLSTSSEVRRLLADLSNAPPNN